jgi:hypothetical protein
VPLDGLWVSARWGSDQAPRLLLTRENGDSTELERFPVSPHVLRVLAGDAVNPAVIGSAARAAMLAGDPNRYQLTLWECHECEGGTEDVIWESPWCGEGAQYVQRIAGSTMSLGARYDGAAL